MKKSFFFFFLTFATFTHAFTQLPAAYDHEASASVPGSFITGNKQFLLNGKPFVIRAAELHYQGSQKKIGSTTFNCAKRRISEAMLW